MFCSHGAENKVSTQHPVRFRPQCLHDVRWQQILEELKMQLLLWQHLSYISYIQFVYPQTRRTAHICRETKILTMTLSVKYAVWLSPLTTLGQHKQTIGRDLKTIFSCFYPHGAILLTTLARNINISLFLIFFFFFASCTSFM